MSRLVRFLPPFAAILLAYGLFLRHLWQRHEGLLLTSADDASRLLIAHAWGKYGIFPLHWTWPPLPMLVDGILVFLGGDAIVWGALARTVAMVGTGLLLATFWQRAFSARTTVEQSFHVVVLLWLFFPVNVRLALSGLSEPYLYALLAIGLVAWQSAGAERPDGESRRLALAGLAFGVSVWCRYEGALAIALFSIWLARRLVRSLRAKKNAREIARDALPLGAAMAPPLVWLVLQYLTFGDPLFFVAATREIVAQEALRAHGQTTMPLHRMLETLRSELWGWPVCALAAIGFLRLLRENAVVARGAGAFLVLYAGMAAVSIGGRMQYYFNLFSLLVLPLAVKGGELLLLGVFRARPLQPFGWRPACVYALLAVGAIVQVVRVDVPEVERGSFGRWLSPEHREVFLALRRSPESRLRSLLVLDATLLDDDHPHTWDPIGLQLADPEHTVVVPYRHALVPGAPLTPWLPELEPRQAALVRDPGALRVWAQTHGFARVLVPAEMLGARQSELARLDRSASE